MRNPLRPGRQNTRTKQAKIQSAITSKELDAAVLEVFEAAPDSATAQSGIRKLFEACRSKLPLLKGWLNYVELFASCT